MHNSNNESSSPEQGASPLEQTAQRMHNSYLTVYPLATFSDWLQGELGCPGVADKQVYFVW